ncbi:MAG: shikimate kinase [Lachnospiraceae bacterium]|nr:shikimate kinase [Lachnospiraceae bacterium]
MGENNNTDYKGIIVLEGYMGSGKSSVGKKLSYRLKCEFNDTDSVIEKQAGKRISDIFATEGEEAFRKMETDLLRKYGEVKNKNLILSLGGGTPVREENRSLIKNIGAVVYLRATPETVYKRVKNSTTRPLLQCEDPFGRIKEMIADRDPAYTECADVIVDVDDKTFGQIVDEILRKVERI